MKTVFDHKRFFLTATAVRQSISEVEIHYMENDLQIVFVTLILQWQNFDLKSNHLFP